MTWLDSVQKLNYKLHRAVDHMVRFCIETQLQASSSGRSHGQILYRNSITSFIERQIPWLDSVQKLNYKLHRAVDDMVRFCTETQLQASSSGRSHGQILYRNSITSFIERQMTWLDSVQKLNYKLHRAVHHMVRFCIETQLQASSSGRSHGQILYRNSITSFIERYITWLDSVQKLNYKLHRAVHHMVRFCTETQLQASSSGRSQAQILYRNSITSFIERQITWLDSVQKHLYRNSITSFIERYITWLDSVQKHLYRNSITNLKLHRAVHHMVRFCIETSVQKLNYKLHRAVHHMVRFCIEAELQASSSGTSHGKHSTTAYHIIKRFGGAVAKPRGDVRHSKYRNSITSFIERQIPWLDSVQKRQLQASSSGRSHGQILWTESGRVVQTSVQKVSTIIVKRFIENSYKQANNTRSVFSMVRFCTLETQLQASSSGRSHGQILYRNSITSFIERQIIKDRVQGLIS